ncbi:hypothetical protein HYU17_00335 [Candidatus Woesearchaeota archaeon]|nr:hypothetical protein [Candidatus Woesearchaeota archaeon]
MNAGKLSELLKVRKAVKDKKPSFKVQKSNDPVKRFAGRWKRPKGIHAKMKLGKRGNPAGVEPGYGSPVMVRGATADGLFPVVIKNIAGLGNVREGQGVVVSAALGIRKKSELVKAAAGRGLRLLNLDAGLFNKNFDELVITRRKRRQGILQKRKVRGESKKEVKESKPTALKPQQPAPAAADIEEKLDDTRKKAEKAEMDRVLTKPR